MEYFIIGVIAIGVALMVWLISSLSQFKKMDNNPENYQERRTFKSLSDSSEEL